MDTILFCGISQTCTMHINGLPSEVLIKIFSYLPLQQYAQTKEVCHRWKTICNCLYSWKLHPVAFDGGTQSTESTFNIVENNKDYIATLIFRKCKYNFIQNVLDLVNNIIHLEFIMCFIDDKMLRIVSKFTKLKKLSFKNSYTMCSEKSLASSMHFEHLVELQKLHLSYFGLTSDNFNGLFKCTNISFLMIEKIKNLPQRLIIEFVNQNRYILKGLAVYGDDFTDDTVQSIALCCNLTQLKIIRCETLTDKSLEHIQTMSNLKKILLWNNEQFTPNGLIALFGNHKMKHLTDVSFSKISKLSIEVVKVMVSNCVSLSFIGFFKCKLVAYKEKEILNLLTNKQTEMFFE